MSIKHLLNTRIVIQSMVEVSTDRYAFTTTTAVYAHIQPATNTKRALEEGIFGKQFRVYIDGASEVSEGDRLQDAEGTYYTVVSAGVSHRNFGSIDFKLVIVEKTT